MLLNSPSLHGLNSIIATENGGMYRRFRWVYVDFLCFLAASFMFCGAKPYVSHARNIRFGTGKHKNVIYGGKKMLVCLTKRCLCLKKITFSFALYNFIRNFANNKQER